MTTWLPLKERRLHDMSCQTEVGRLGTPPLARVVVTQHVLWDWAGAGMWVLPSGHPLQGQGRAEEEGWVALSWKVVCFSFRPWKTDKSMFEPAWNF